MARRFRWLLPLSVFVSVVLPGVAAARATGTLLDPGYRLALLKATDVVTLKDGTVLVGEILREGEEGLVFKDKDGKTRLIKYDDVDNIETTRPADKKPDGNTETKTAPPPPPPPRANPEVEVRRAQLLQQRQVLVSQRARVRIVSPIITALGGLVIIGIAAVAPGFSPDTRLVYTIVGGVVIALGGGSFCLALTRRARLDREINAIDRQLSQLNAMGRVFPRQTLPDVWTVELAWRF